MDEFCDLYMCKFESSKLMTLVDKIVEYYKSTDNAANEVIANERRKLTIWRCNNGFSSDDYQRAKKIASGIRY